MKIFAVQFDYGSANGYDKLATVLQHSAKKYAPNAEFVLWRIEAPKVKRENKSFDSNHYKLEQWAKFVETTDDDVILMDGDMFILNDITKGFNDKEFDIGLCDRGRSNLPWNGGVVFVRNTPAAKDFIARWIAIDIELFQCKQDHYKWRNHFGGMNQASLGKMLSQKKHTAKIKSFPCGIWNACVEHWNHVDPKKTMVVHVKSGLRRAVLGGDTTSYKAASMHWYQLAAECGVSRKGGLQNLYHYENYQQYVDVQKKTSEEKKDRSWVDKCSILGIARHIRKKIEPAFILCHGTRAGNEQLYFMKAFPGAQVLGTEIADYADKIPNTVKHDFNIPKDEWTGKADVVYSNAFDHAFEPMKTLNVWLSQLSKTGILIIEHSDRHQKRPSITDPYSFEASEFTKCVSDWTKRKYRVSTIISEPVRTDKGKSRIAQDKYNAKFIFIERSKSSGEEFEEARAKALGYPR